MPNRIPAWNVATLSGNPTKSQEVNRVISFVLTQEVRTRRGKKPTVKRPLTLAEFRIALTLFTQLNDFQYRFRYTTMMKFQ